MRRRFLLTALLMFGLWLAACTPQADPTPDSSTPMDGEERQTATPVPLTVEGWLTAAEPITPQNIMRLRPLGELHTVEPASTLFTYALSPDQTRLAALNLDVLTVWDLVNGETLFTQSHGGATAVYFSPDKTALYLLTPDGVLALLNAETGAALDELRLHPDYTAHAYAPDEGLMAVGGSDGSIKVWDVLARRSLTTFAEGAPVAALAFSPDGETLFASDDRGALNLWQWRDQTLTATASTNAAPFDSAYSEDGRHIAINTGRLLVWDTLTGNLREIPTVAGGLMMRFVRGQPFLMLDSENGLEIWNLLTMSPAAVLTELKGAVQAATSPDGALMFALVRASEAGASVWSLSNLSSGSVARGTFAIETPTLFDVAWTQDGFLLLVFDTRGFVTLWGIAES